MADPVKKSKAGKKGQEYTAHNYSTGNMGKHHPLLVHPGYFDPALRSSFYPHIKSQAQQDREAAEKVSHAA